MRTFNRTVAILLLVGLFVVGVFAVVCAAGLFGYRLSELPVDGLADGVAGFVRGVEGGSLPPAAVGALVGTALLGVILLVMELKPRRPRRIRMEKGTYAAKGFVRRRVEEAAEMVPGVLGSSAKAKARRRRGARVELEAKIRRGEDAGLLKKEVRDRVAERLEKGGVPAAKIKVRVEEVDPRRAKARVR